MGLSLQVDMSVMVVLGLVNQILGLVVHLDELHSLFCWYRLTQVVLDKGPENGCSPLVTDNAGCCVRSQEVVFVRGSAASSALCEQ